MYRLAVFLIVVPLACAAGKDNTGSLDACNRGRAEAARKASDYQGEERMKRLIQADLTRAANEEAEGDVDECLEALDHANKLIAGQY
ncbi:MAG: hypothetical protein ABSC06_18070 [Rhodopila sp.]|jgi:hypothetical protein